LSFESLEFLLAEKEDEIKNTEKLEFSIVLFHPTATTQRQTMSKKMYVLYKHIVIANP
jgi:hypothetical protein